MSEKSSTYRHARLLARLPTGVVGAALAVRLVDEWWSYLPAGVVEDLHRDLDISYAGAAWLLTLLYLGDLVTSPLGLLADHVDRRVTASIGALLLAAGMAVFAVGAPYPALAAASLLLGAASGLVVGPLEAALADVAGDRLDRLLGQQHALTFVGDLAGPALLALGAATALGWRGAFGVTAAALVLFALWLAATPFPPPIAAADSAAGALRDALAIARRRDVWRLAGIEVLLSPLDEPLVAFVIARAAAGGLAQGAGTSTQGAAGGLAQLLAVAAVVGGLGGSVLVARRGLPRSPLLGPVALAGGAVAAAVTDGFVVNLLAMGAVGVGMGLVWAALHHRLLTIVPGRSGTVSTVVGVASSAGALILPVLGAVADAWGLTAALSGYAVFALLIVVQARGALAPRRTGQRRSRQGQKEMSAESLVGHR